MLAGEPSERASLHARLSAELARGRDQPAPVEQLDDRLLASWRRSQDYGVPLEDVNPVFTGSFDTESLFFECGQEVLRSLHKTLAAEPISLMLTDADGVVLNRLCGDQSLLRALDAVHLARASRTRSGRPGRTAWGSPWPIAYRRSSAPRSTTS